MINILLLFIYSEKDEYEEMLKLQKLYIHTHKNIDSYFVTYRENQDIEVVLENDFVYVKGKEGFLNILYKTLKAIEYLTNIKHYDYVIRTNISTIFKLNEVYDILLNKMDRTEIYTGGFCYSLLNYRDRIMGLTDETFKYYGINGCPFIQGTCIIFSNDVVKYMLKNKDKFIYDVIDDVSISLFMRSFMSHVHKKINNTERIEININSYNPGPIIRNKHDDLREKDINNMKEFVNEYLKNIDI
jgi:hypothetical protein